MEYGVLSLVHVLAGMARAGGTMVIHATLFAA
jgi:hypothetical protein